MLENVIAVISISPSLSEKEEHTKKPWQTEDKLDHNHTLKESRLCLFLAGLLHYWVSLQRRGWCAAGRCVPRSWSLLGAVLA